MNLTETHILVKALSATQSPVTITDNRLPDNPITYCNEAFIRLTGYTKKEILGKNCRFLQGPDTDPKAVDQLRKGIKAKRDVSVVMLNYTKKKRPFWNDLQVSPVYNENGELTHFIGLQNDVTERIEQERAQAAARQLAYEKKILADERERLLKINEAKDDFIAVASHQLRTPATVVKQYLGMLTSGMLGNFSDPQRHAIDVAYQNNDRQLKIIDDLLRIARIDTGKVVINRTDTNVGKLLESVAEEFKYRLIDSNQKLVIKHPKKPIHINIDTELIRTVLENIIDNAIKYSEAQATIHISSSSNAAMTKIKIEDQGNGMSEADLEKIFRKFVRAASKHARDKGGTGLGLYWAKAVLDMHDASIDVQSTLGKGTTFTLCFPAASTKINGKETF